MTMRLSEVQEESVRLRMELRRLTQEIELLRESARMWIRMYEQLLKFHTTGYGLWPVLGVDLDVSTERAGQADSNEDLDRVPAVRSLSS